MLVVHVIRKPLSEGNVASNVLKWGTGALNIDASRIVTGENLKGGSGGLLSNVRDEKEWGYHAGAEDNGFRPSPGGRWPANLILGHKPGCEQTGVQKVSGTKPRPGGKGDRFKDAGSLMSRTGHEGVRTDHHGFADADGTEVIPKWDCQEGCPVAALDEQTGVLTTNPGTYRKTGREGEGSTYALDSQEGRVLSKGDSGGASRYFKQVKS